jgi:hypothetical protein
MSRTPHAAVSRPSLVDYLLLLAGCSLSLLLLKLSPIRVEAGPRAGSGALHDLVEALPDPMRLPEGIILLWPLFFLTQRLLGRVEGLTGAEWLWVIAWLGVVLLTALAAWERHGSLPEWLAGLVERYPPRLLWYMVVIPVLGVLALVFLLAGLLRQEPPPWTHGLSIALVLWPLGPLGAIVLLGKFI